MNRSRGSDSNVVPLRFSNLVSVISLKIGFLSPNQAADSCKQLLMHPNGHTLLMMGLSLASLSLVIRTKEELCGMI